ncbi:hypothetical protein KIPB_014249, partial [Kipferlia bialata]|eukprot:g14249.t1
MLRDLLTKGVYEGDSPGSNTVLMGETHAMQSGGDAVVARVTEALRESRQDQTLVCS